MVIDPVCGMPIDETHSKHLYKSQGQIWHFCSSVCKETFIYAAASDNSDKSKKSWMNRLLRKIAGANNKCFGNHPPTCH